MRLLTNNFLISFNKAQSLNFTAKSVVNQSFNTVPVCSFEMPFYMNGLQYHLYKGHLHSRTFLFSDHSSPTSGSLDNFTVFFARSRRSRTYCSLYMFSIFLSPYERKEHSTLLTLEIYLYDFIFLSSLTNTSSFSRPTKIKIVMRNRNVISVHQVRLPYLVLVVLSVEAVHLRDVFFRHRVQVVYDAFFYTSTFFTLHNQAY